MLFFTHFFLFWKLIEIDSYIIEKSNEVCTSTSGIREWTGLYGPNSEYMFPCKDSLLLDVRMLEQVMSSWLVEVWWRPELNERCVPCHVPCRGTFFGRHIKELDLKRIYVMSERRVQMSTDVKEEYSQWGKSPAPYPHSLIPKVKAYK